MTRSLLAMMLMALALLPSPQAQAHGFELFGGAPFRFGISMYIARPLRVGVTQPVFECWCRKLLWDKAELVVFTRDELQPLDDAAWQRTRQRLESVDLFFVTENPKLEFAEALLEKADMMYQRPLIYVDLGVPPLESKYEDPYPERIPPLPHFSMYTASQLMYAIVNACMRMDQSNTVEFRRNWQDYMVEFEFRKRRIMERHGPWRNVEVRAVTLRGGPEYLVEEAGMVIAGVAPPIPDGPITMDAVAATAEALRKLKAGVLVSVEPLDGELREALQNQAGAVVCELQTLPEACRDPHEFSLVMEENYRRLLDARAAVWAWADWTE